MKIEEFTDVAHSIIMNCIKQAKEAEQGPSPEHLLVSMLENSDSVIPAIFVNHKLDQDALISELKKYLQLLPKPIDNPEDSSEVVNVTPRLIAMLERSKKSAKDVGDSYIDTITLFKQFYTEGTDNYAHNLLLRHGASQEIVSDSYVKIRGKSKVQTRKERAGDKILLKYCKDMLKSAAQSEYSPVIGRDLETRRKSRSYVESLKTILL